MNTCTIKKDMRFGVRTDVTIKKTVYWDSVSCRMVEISKPSEIIYCLPCRCKLHIYRINFLLKYSKHHRLEICLR